jgi:putative ABC transport system permease protein
MLRNYFKTLLRNMQKHTLHTVINVAGMAVAFTCTILLILLVYFQFSFDAFHVNKHRLYQVYHSATGPQGVEVGGSMAYPAAPTFKAEGIGIEKATRYKYAGRGVRYRDKELELQTRLVDTDFLSMFSFPVRSGNKANPLADLGSVVLSEYAAEKIFGHEDPIGKSIRANVNGEWKVLVVSAVTEDFPKNSTLNFDLLVRTEISADYIDSKDRWDNQNHSVYVQLAPGATQQQVEKQLQQIADKYNPADTAFLKNKGYMPDKNGKLYSMQLLPMKEVHFNAAISGGNTVSKSFLYVLLLVAFVIVVIACFNFINLNIGLAFTRTKEMGIRKCLGAGKRQVWLQIWGESFFILVAMIIGAFATILIVQYLTKTSQVGVTTSLLYQPTVIAILIAILFAVSFVASGYPSFIMGKLKTVEILKGKISLKKPGVFRNALIVVQFVIACVLIAATIVIYQQFQYLRNAPLGYTTASLISIPIHDQGAGKNIVSQMRTRLSSQSSIISVSGTSVNMGVGKDGSTSKSTSGFDFNGRPITTNWLVSDYDILKTLDIKPKGGRDFTTSYVSDSNYAVIVSESMAKQLSDDKNVVGLQFNMDSTGPKWNVIGVIPDFHLYSMREKAEPLTISMAADGQLSYVLVRVATQNPRATMDLVKRVYAQVEPGVEFKGTYVDENIERWYESERVLSRMFSIAALVAIVLSCMGLFGIAFIVIRQRVKEIGVRKVLGASVGSVAILVTKEFIKPVLVAIIIALPIAWWATNKWLEGFEYRISVQWTLFFVAAFIAVFIAVATVSVQAIKAAVANPVKSLRTE